MIELLECETADCTKAIYRKGDDFVSVLEFVNEDEFTPFDTNQVEMIWTISDPSGVLVTISGEDLTIEQNYILFRKPASFFEGFFFMSSYTHKLFDNTSNTTFFEGEFSLK